MRVVDHTDKRWLKKFAFGGAYTYSQDIIKYQLPLWEDVLVNDDDLITTCPPLEKSEVRGRYKNVIHYLHKYPVSRAVRKLQDAMNTYNIRYDNLIFLTAYKQFEQELKHNGVKAVYIPMAIDVPYIQSLAQPKAGHNRVIYYGNIYPSKKTMFYNLKRFFENRNIGFDFISKQRFNNQPNILTHEQSIKLVSTYKYGIGVGRCALEMQALGLRIMVGGNSFGGIATTKQEWDNQLMTNFNTRYSTFGTNISYCWRNIQKTVVISNDITQINHPEEVLNHYKLI